MIILRSEKGEIYNLFTRTKHVVGRNGNLELDGDRSVSRQHAAIYVTVKDKKVQIKLHDLGAKYGTFVNGNDEEIAKDTVTTLKIGDKIRFGLQWNTWTIEESQFVVCVSVLTPPQKQSLTRLLSRMNGIVVSDWSDSCSHLTTHEIQITTNVVQALGRVKPIVSLEYWSVLADVLNSTKEEHLPNCDDYVPPLTEPDLKHTPTDLKMINSRRKLFGNMKFVACTTSHYNKVQSMVSHAGGTVVDGTRTVFKEEEFQNENIVVLDGTINKRNRNLAQLLKILQTRKHRRIAEKEIGMSLILNSTELYCNPALKPDFINRQESQVVIKDEEASVLDLETQELDEESSTQFFNTTDSNNYSLAINDGRILSDDDDEKDVQIIHDTPEVVEPVVECPPAKRKRADSSEQSSSKSIKMTDWIIRKPSTKPNIPIEPPSQVVENNKKPTKNLFAFVREEKPADKGSDSLFKTSNSSTSSSDRVDFMEKRKRTSIELFSSESSAPPAKKANVDTKNLFQMPSTSKTTRTGSLILFESDTVDSPSQKSSKLKPIVETSNKENASVVVPKKVTPSLFNDSSKNKCKNEVKEEPDDNMSFDTKDVFNQSIILTLPLMKPNTQRRQSLNTTNGSAVNFKKFRKNNGINRSRVIPTDELVVYTYKLNLNGDSGPTNYSDSD